MVDYGDRIFENYEMFIKEHKDDISTPSGAIEMLSSDGAFRAYIDALTEGLEPYTKRSIMAIAEREREMLLEESINVGPSAAVVGYAVSYFPILTDIYSDPILAQIATTYPVNKSIITVPKISINSTVKNFDGSTSSYNLPSISNIARVKPEDIDLLPSRTNNVFALSNGGSSLVTSETAFLNKRYFAVTKISYTDTKDVAKTFGVLIRPDARGQLNYTQEFVEQTGATAADTERFSLTVIGNVNWDTGVVQYNTTFANLSDPLDTAGQAVTTITANVVFSARTGDIGRVKVGIDISGWDVNIDVRDSFEIRLDQEIIQDYSDIYQVDMIRTLSMAIKNQMLYNKDCDLAYLLGINEPIFTSFGSAATYDMNRYTVDGNHFTPASVLDIFKGIIPHITTVNRNIRRVFRADPQFLVTGLRTASMLESLQQYIVRFPDNNNGQSGFSSSQNSIDFRTQKILASDAVPDNKIYPIYRAPNDDLTRTAIVDFIYKPLYIIEEIDNSQRRTFVKSRTAIELTAPEAMGVITMTNYTDFV